ncbi:hypothetical protein LCR01_13890 [Companilactobacillus crustorum]|uniref:Uncharacterized protein n=3 Tax=Companilactobacillus TaxID=2767879 RepID=A0A837RGN1_9LACO|nr:hypothetical protein [Companilactobacillus crustorum]HCD07256.1 hypothetical protein [Lactobacillus sp.]APU71506.1 hypothetical protein BI355_1187 [Companilactobacillus crustorum]KRK42043.1 hypothetical protein FD26_GL000914 [Companilactobacillus crustorum JCM 15951]KRO20083.1 hypothetical protein IV63_GL001037 [Companilactobacillus crustorum]GEO76946.1 hypothetical protein LCR01_13890 [Companilactobacillus crustorum]
MLSTIEKASELLKDDSVTVLEIEKFTKISQKKINEVRRMPENAMDLLTYSEAVALEDMYNNLQIDYINESNDNDFYKFVIRMGDWFSEAIENQEDYYDSEDAMPDDLKIASAIQELNNISTSNKSIMLDLYFSYMRNEQESA